MDGAHASKPSLPLAILKEVHLINVYDSCAYHVA